MSKDEVSIPRAKVAYDVFCMVGSVVVAVGLFASAVYGVWRGGDYYQVWFPAGCMAGAGFGFIALTVRCLTDKNWKL